jgi:Flp pilus assembly protein TadG
VIVTERARSHQATVVRSRFPRTSRERGAAAVEMAIVMPLLVAMIIGIIDFSRVFNAELQLSQAAREGVRIASILPQATSTAIASADKASIENRALLAAPNPAFGAALPRAGVIVVPPYCTASPLTSDVATVTVQYIFSGIGPWFQGKTLQQTAVMRCAG